MRDLELVVKTVKSYQRLLDSAARADAREGNRQGIEEARQGKGRDAEEFSTEFEAAHAYRVKIVPRAWRDLACYWLVRRKS